MSFSKVLGELDSYLKSGGRRREALDRLLLNGKISRNTFDSMDKRLTHLTSTVTNLKETLEAEEPFWKTDLSENTRILECLLAELELRRLLGEIREEEWTRKSTIIILGLDWLKRDDALTIEPEKEPALPTQTMLEEHEDEKALTELRRQVDLSDGRSHLSDKTRARFVGKESPAGMRPNMNKRRRSIAKEPPNLANSLGSRMRCMNPWKPECRSIDIGLSIYYKGQMVPICRRCWEDISKKNVEWSSL